MTRLIYVTSTVADGNMSLKWGEKSEVLQNRSRFLEKNGIKIEDCVFTSLVHDKDVVIVKKANKGKIVEADGFIVTEKEIAIFMLTGDCLPVVYFDQDKSILGVAHLGWRGVDKGLAGEMVKNLIDLGVDSNVVHVWIGPGVRKETYLKYGEGIPRFWKEISLGNKHNWEKFSKIVGEELSLDLVGFVKHQLC